MNNAMLSGFRCIQDTSDRFPRGMQLANRLSEVRECANCCAWSSTRMHNEHFGVHMTVPVEEWTGQAFLLRDIFGNPFRPITLDPRWLTSTVVDLAQAIYNERAFDRMPILSDALMDAGCDSEDIILHCRGDGPHVRGCWVVDLLLGKE